MYTSQETNLRKLENISICEIQAYLFYYQFYKIPDVA